MVVHHRVTPSIKLPSTHLYPWVERGNARVKCLAQEHNTMTLARARTQTIILIQHSNHHSPYTCMYYEIIIMVFYYMATCSSMSGQDDANHMIWLATQAGKMELSCPLGTTCCVPQERISQNPYNKSFIDQTCSVKMAGYWPHSFLWVYGPQLCLGP